MNLLEMFENNGLKVLKEEIDKLVNDWQDVDNYSKAYVPFKTQEADIHNVVEERLAVLKKLQAALDEHLSTVTYETNEIYQAEEDITFVMECSYVNGNLKSQECVGWYHGEPNAYYTAQYSDRKMKATYDL